MHDTAYEHGRLFFHVYISDAFRTVVELGSQDVNGSLRDHCPPGIHYIGLDVMPAKGVDVVIDPDAPLPFAADSIDAVVTSSAFEHDPCFWDTFVELARILRPGGLLYLNAPSNGGFHRYPLDCWRFYPDAGIALQRHAERRGHAMELVESFIGLPQEEKWADFVAVFRKAGGPAPTAKGRIADHAAAVNIHRSGAPLAAESDDMPDAIVAGKLRSDLAESRNAAAALVADLESAQQSAEAARLSNESLTATLAASQAEAAALQQRLGEAIRDLRAIEASTSWRLTAGLRWLRTHMGGR